MKFSFLVASYVSVKPKRWLFHPLVADSIDDLDKGLVKKMCENENCDSMNNEEVITKKSRGGRPEKRIKQNQFIGVKCSLLDKTILKQKAKAAGVSLSEYLKATGLKGQTVMKMKALPKEVLSLTATINHIAANINQIARNCNTYNNLSAGEKRELQELINELRQLVTDIKNYLR